MRAKILIGVFATAVCGLLGAAPAGASTNVFILPGSPITGTDFLTFSTNVPVPTGAFEDYWEFATTTGVNISITESDSDAKGKSLITGGVVSLDDCTSSCNAPLTVPGGTTGTHLRMEQSGFRPDQQQYYQGAKGG